METPQLFRKADERTFFAHHMLLHAAERQIAEAESAECGRFNKCLSAMVLTALAIEALANAVGTRVAADWPTFERLRPHEKLDYLVAKLGIARDVTKDPWTALQYLSGFRNDIAHPKPEDLARRRVLPAVALDRAAFDKPRSSLEREITLGNARRAFKAVHELKGLLADALPVNKRFGIYADMWHGSTSPHVP
jgi:hypothetical protein